MSMCFVYKDVLYADRFLIHDYRGYSPGLIDNKIHVSESGKVIVAIMSQVPKNIPNVVERLDRAYSAYCIELKDKKEPLSAKLTFENSINVLDVDLLAVFRSKSKEYTSLISAHFTNERKVQHFNDGTGAQLHTPDYTPGMLMAGMTPAQIFKGVSIFKGTVSKEYTAYDILRKKFI